MAAGDPLGPMAGCVPPGGLRVFRMASSLPADPPGLLPPHLPLLGFLMAHSPDLASFWACALFDWAWLAVTSPTVWLLLTLHPVGATVP